MRLSQWLLAAAGLATMNGCQVAETVPPAGAWRTAYHLREEPHRAAVCIARNIDRRGEGLDARIRQGQEPVLVEVHVSAGAPVGLAQLLIAGDGSTAVISMMPDPRYDIEDLVATMIGGC